MEHPQTSKFADEILQELSSTQYACSSLEPLSGGTANFIFRGALSTALPDGTREVAIKHGEGYVASSPGFQLPTARCQTEEECLKALSGLPATPGAFAVRAPKLHYFNAATNTQVQEYLPHALSLKDYALKHFTTPASSDPSRKPRCVELGRSLGAWLRAFHDWAALPVQHGLREAARANQPMQQLKHVVNYTTLVQTVENFPDVLGDARETFERIREEMAKELQREDLQVIHGDFWTGNALLPDQPLRDAQTTPIFIVDWEMCQLALPALDLGQMIAELYELWLFKTMAEGKWLIEGFAAGYGVVDDDAFAFRTALHAGTHLVAWGSRVAGWGDPDQVRHVVGVGKEVILRAWSRDRAWFEAGDLACLFGGGSQ